MSKYRVFSGLYFPVFSPHMGLYLPGKTPHLDTFHTVIAYHLSCKQELNCLSSILVEMSQKHSWKIHSSALQTVSPQVFNMQILMWSWPCTLLGSKFCIILAVSSSENLIVFRRFSAEYINQLGRLLLLPINEHCLAKNILKSSTFLFEICYKFVFMKDGRYNENLSIN